MTYSFRPATSFTERHGLFVGLVGSTNSGKTYSALRLARGIAGPKGKIAVADSEGGRTLHLKKDFAFDVMMMDAPHRPQRYAQMAKAAEDAGYDALVIDSFSAEWAGVGGVLAWADEEAQRIAGGDAAKLERSRGASWIKPKGAHKNMVYSLLERRIPIIFSIRGEETFKPPNEKFFKAICNQNFLFEVTVSFRLAADRKGIIDLSDKKSFKMEGVHQSIFRDGELLSEKHGEALAAWARGAAAQPMAPTTAAPAEIHMPLDFDGTPDWTAWLKLAGAAIRSAPDAEWLAEWDTLNRSRIEGLREVSAANADRLAKLLLDTRQKFDTPEPEPAAAPPVAATG